MADVALPQLRLGVLGTRRGAALADRARRVGFVPVAVCSLDAGETRRAAEGLEALAVPDIDALLGAGLDALVVANYFDEHAAPAMAALEAGIHVLSENAACGSLAEGAALVEAAEISDAVYMAAANFAYGALAQTLRRMVTGGELGDVLYAESESIESLPPGVLGSDPAHWHNRITSPQYCENALAPLLAVTGQVPTSVSAAVIPDAHGDDSRERASRTARGAAALFLLELSGGTTARVLRGVMPGNTPLWMRLHGSTGLAEGVRGGEPAVVAESHGGDGDLLAERIRLRREPWQHPSAPIETVYSADWLLRDRRNDYAGAVGGDILMLEHFARCIADGEAPLVDVHAAVTMAAVGILGTRSALNNTEPLAVPNTHHALDREQMRADTWAPAIL